MCVCIHICIKKAKVQSGKLDPGTSSETQLQHTEQLQRTHFHEERERKERYAEIGLGKVIVKSLKHRNRETKKHINPNNSPSPWKQTNRRTP